MFDKDGVMTHFPIYGSEGQLLHLSENTLLITQIVTDDTFPGELFGARVVMIGQNQIPLYTTF